MILASSIGRIACCRSKSGSGKRVSNLDPASPKVRDNRCLSWPPPKRGANLISHFGRVVGGDHVSGFSRLSCECPPAWTSKRSMMLCCTQCHIVELKGNDWRIMFRANRHFSTRRSHCLIWTRADRRHVHLSHPARQTDQFPGHQKPTSRWSRSQREPSIHETVVNIGAVAREDQDI